MKYKPSKQVVLAACAAVCVVLLVALARFAPASPRDTLSVSTAGSAAADAARTEAQKQAQNYALDYARTSAGDEFFLGGTSGYSARNNVTLSLSQNAFDALSAATAGGAVPSQNAQTSLIDSLSNQVPIQDAATPFTQNYIHLTTTSADTVSTYTKTLGVALSKHPDVFAQGTLTRVQTLVNSQSADASTTIGTLRDSYQSLADSMASMNVPGALRAEHADLTNDFYQIASALSGVATVQNDPVRAILALGRYASFRSKQVDAVAALTRTLQGVLAQYPSALAPSS